jgi:hypothetical protein
MRYKSLLLAVAIAVVLLGGTGFGLVLLLRHEPAFYVRAAVPPGQARTDCSDDFSREFSQRLLNGIVNKRRWDARFTEEQINSYLAEDFITKHNGEHVLPQGVCDPRISLEADGLRVGFRYGKGSWSTVISVDLQVWLVKKEPNVVALEFKALHAGALPISAQSILERIAEMAQQQNIEVTWYRHQGHPVVLLRFEADRSNPTFLLQQLELRPGTLRIIGRSLDGVQRASSTALAPVDKD